MLINKHHLLAKPARTGRVVAVGWRSDFQTIPLRIQYTCEMRCLSYSITSFSSTGVMVSVKVGDSPRERPLIVKQLYTIINYLPLRG